MNKTTVQSSNIRSIGYDDTQQLLEVEFNNSRIYHYFGVPQNKYQNLMNASSHGRYLANEIIGKYRDAEQ